VSKSTSSETEQTTNVEPKPSVRCKSCNYEVTSPEWVRKPHEHTFRNPEGYSFHVVCYSDAPGAIEVGQPTAAACWFPGYEWSFAVCGQCQTHLGWWYIGRDRFAGLIATRLIRK
jgi:hypothetical protein